MHPVINYTRLSSTQICLTQSPVLTVNLPFVSESESNEFVARAARQVFGGPAENGPVAGHVHEDCRLLQMMQDPPALSWGERFSGHSL